jgi:hypothetical protein
MKLNGFENRKLKSQKRNLASREQNSRSLSSQNSKFRVAGG